MNIESRINAVNEQLERADTATHSLVDASKSLGALIIAVSYLVEIIEEQQRQIDALKGDSHGT